MKRRPRVTHLEQLPEGVVLYTKAQMAALLQVSIRCLCEMMRRGEVSYLKIGGKMVRFRMEDVQKRLSETVLVCHGEAKEDHGTTDHATTTPGK